VRTVAEATPIFNQFNHSSAIFIHFREISNIAKEEL